MAQEAVSPGLRKWFLAAAIYNVIWGAGAIFFPILPFIAAGASAPSHPSLFQCIGMMVMVFGLGYWYIYKDPIRFGYYVWIGLLGKTFGPIGFLYAASLGELPWAFGVTLIFNDLIWWPAFWTFALRHAKNPLDPAKSQ
jgi:hypothetical protein